MRHHLAILVRPAAVAAAAIVLMSSTVAKADVTWAVPAGQIGDWSVASNWSGNLAPTPGDNVWIVNGGTASVTQVGEEYYSLTVGSSAGNGTVEMYGGNLSSPNYGNLYVGSGGAGSFVQSGGSNSNSNVLAIGTSAGGYGTYSLTGVGVLNAQAMNVNNGTFTQMGGTANVNWYLSLGDSPGSVGTVVLGGGGLFNGDSVEIGYESGAGNFIQTGGTCLAGGLFVNSGSYSLSGNSVLTASAIWLPNSFAAPGSSGIFNQSAGVNSTSELAIGPGGIYQFTGGTLAIKGGLQNWGVFDGGGGQGALVIGASSILDLSQGSTVNTGSMSLSIGPGSLLIIPPGFNPATAFAHYSNSGMTHTAGTPLVVAAGQSFSGWGTILDPVICQGSISGDGYSQENSFVLKGGLIMSGSAQVIANEDGGVITNDSTSGMSGGTPAVGYHNVTGTFTQTGGVNASESLSIADHGTYVLNGPGQVVINQEGVGSGGGGTFIQTAGTNSVNELGTSSGTAGRYELSGNGLLSANTIYAGGIFNQSGGTIIVSSLTLASSVAYNLSGSGTLIAYVMYVGQTGVPGVFTQNGGTAAASDLGIVDGAYNLNGGLLIVPGVYGGASFKLSGGTLQFSGTSSSAPMILGTSGGATFNTAGLTVTCSGAISGSGSLTKVGSGTLILTAASYTGGTTIDGGVLEFASGPPTSGQITLNNGGALAAYPGNVTTWLASGAITPSSSGALAIAASSYSTAVNLTGFSSLYLGSLGNSTYSGILTPGSNGYLLGDFGGTLTVKSALTGSYGATINGNVVLAGSDTYSGPTAVNGGVLQVGSSTALPAGTTAAVNGTLDLNTFSASVLSLAGSGVIDTVAGGTPTLTVRSGSFSGTLQNTSQSLALNKTGSGTLVLSGNSTYLGTTTVSAGQLSVNGSLLSAVTVNSGGTLGGAGSLTNVTVNRGAQIAPGSPLGPLSIGGALIMEPGATIACDLDTPFTSSLILAHEVTLNGQDMSSLNFTPTVNFEPGTYDLIEAGLISGSLGSTTSGTIDGDPASIAVVGNNLLLTVVPEPSTLAVLAAGLVGFAGAGLRVRRRSTGVRSYPTRHGEVACGLFNPEPAAKGRTHHAPP